MADATAEIEGEGTKRSPSFDLIELMFFAYRDFVQDADRILAKFGFGRAHHRVLYFATRRPGLTVAELLDILKITKQSLNRVLKELLDRGYMTNRLGETDKRQRLLFATPLGEDLIWQIARVQSTRFDRAFETLPSGAREEAYDFLRAMVDTTQAAADADDLFRIAQGDLVSAE